MRSSRWLVFNDPHIPFHDKAAVQLMLDVAKDVDVTGIVINGDLLDFYQIHDHGAKHPQIIETLDKPCVKKSI